MSDELSETLLGDDDYERAAALTRRVFPLSLLGKIRVCLATLLLTAVLLPAVTYRMELVRTLEGTNTVAGSTPAFVLVAAVGTASTFLFGLLFVAQRRFIETHDLDFEAAERQIRIEDMLMTFMISTGLLFVLAPVVLALLGVLAPELVVALYERDIEIYQLGRSRLADARLVSGAGPVLALVLFVANAAVAQG